MEISFVCDVCRNLADVGDKAEELMGIFYETNPSANILDVQHAVAVKVDEGVLVSLVIKWEPKLHN